MSFVNPFPKGVYLDNNATMPLLPSVREALRLAVSEDVANPSSIHQPGQKAKALVHACKKELSEWLGTREADEWVFVSGATEAINSVLRSFADAPVAYSAVDHSAVVESLFQDKKFEFQVTPQGQIETSSFDSLIDFISSSSQPCLLNWQLANNETGVCFDIMYLQQLVEKFNVPGAPQKLFVLVDAAQALGKCDESFIRRAMHFADYLVCSGHKIGAPMGIGALWMRGTAPYKPLISGGTQEKRRRAGTHNMLGIVGFYAALQDWKKNSITYRTHMKSLRDAAFAQLSQVEGFVLHGENLDTNLCNTMNFHFEGCRDESLVLALDLEKFFVSSGSACNSGSLKASRVLKKMGLEEEAALSSMRFCVGPETSLKEVLLFCERLLHRVAHIRTSRSKWNALLPTMESKE